MAQNVWQIASGAWGRDYSDVFVKYDVMLMGPGDPGPFDRKAYSALITSGRHTKKYIDSLGSFVHAPKQGDLVLLRQGHRVLQIGIVASDDYLYQDAFDDVWGWDLQHTKRVVWQEHLADELAAIQKTKLLFGHRKSVPAFTGVSEQLILNRIAHLFPKVKERKLKKLPNDPGPRLTLEEFGEALFSKGLSNDSVEKLLAAFRKQRRLTGWYSDVKAGRRPSEHEIIGHLVLPMFLALGWSEQLLAIEWQKVDLAAFNQTPTIAKSCVLVCEAKAPGHGLMGDLNQAIGYSEKLKLEICSQILLTEGTRFYIYSRQKDGKWGSEPSGYFNTGRLRVGHLLHTNADPTSSVIKLSPTALFHR